MMSELIILNSNGDDRTVWSKDDAEAYREAKEQFDKLKAKGWFAYKVTGKWGKEEIKEFDPNADKIVMSPPVVGG